MRPKNAVAPDPHATDSQLLEAFFRAGHLVAARREVRQAPSAYEALSELGFPDWAIAEVAAFVAFDDE